MVAFSKFSVMVAAPAAANQLFAAPAPFSGGARSPPTRPGGGGAARGGPRGAPVPSGERSSGASEGPRNARPAAPGASAARAYFLKMMAATPTTATRSDGQRALGRMVGAEDLGPLHLGAPVHTRRRDANTRRAIRVRVRVHTADDGPVWAASRVPG